MIIIYTQHGCHPCRKTKQHCERLGIDFEERNVAENVEFLEEVKNLGYLSTPVVVVDENTHWNGYHPEKLDILAKTF